MPKVVFFSALILAVFSSCSGDLEYIDPNTRHSINSSSSETSVDLSSSSNVEEASSSSEEEVGISSSSEVVQASSSSSSKASSSSGTPATSSSSSSAISSSSATVNFPYPQNKAYGNNTINVIASGTSNTLKNKFEAFMENFYRESMCGGTIPCANIEHLIFESTPGTYPQDIGYAMLMTVYFSNKSKSYQSEFDKLWAYYNYWKNAYGLMRYDAPGYNNNIDFIGIRKNSATDADLDVALALVMARFQFGEQKYENYAKELIKKIWEYEFENDGLHKVSDNYGITTAPNDKNPGYVSPAAFEVFKNIGATGSWNYALERNYYFLMQNQSGITGLPSGLADQSGYPIANSNYDENAVRAPWRWALANAWFGHDYATTLLRNLASKIPSSPQNISGPIPLNGPFSIGKNDNSYYRNSLMCALTVSSNYQGQLNFYWDYLQSYYPNEPYFDSAMQILTGLLVTGNMPNLMGLK